MDIQQRDSKKRSVDPYRLGGVLMGVFLIVLSVFHVEEVAVDQIGLLRLIDGVVRLSEFVGGLVLLSISLRR
jgi:hypothetical protein